MKETHNDHHEHHGHDHEHQHRSKIQFDRNGIPKVLSPKESVHSEDYPDDYSKAVNTYRKTFPNKQRVLAETPDPGVKEMMERMAYLNIDTAFDRFDAQQPQCIFGLGGTCCKNCNMGPCRITKKSPRGVCGADADLIVARNLLRSAAAGAAQHGMHAREVILMLKWAAQGKMDIAIDGEHKIRTMAKAFGIQTAHRQLKHITIDLADRLLKDLSQTEPDDYATISACAPKERQQIWKEMDILPISAYHEVFEAYHKSGCAIDSDWESIMRQFLRCGLVFTFSGVLGTGALDLWVADVQEIYPAIMDVARCYQTTVVTTSDSNRLPGAEHIGYDHHHSNIDETGQIAERIVERAIESFEKRRHIPVFIPPYEIEAEVGFSVEYIQKIHGGLEKMAEALRSGEILGIVNLVGCNNPKVVYEKAIVDVAEVLLKHNVLIITNGCASFPLMKLGFCQTTELAYGRVGASLRAFLDPDNLPPVWHVGECIDNARSSAFFAGIAGEFDRAIHEMPYAFTSPEWSNEKGLDASLGFRLMGVNTYHCVEAPIHGSEKVIRFLKEDTRSTLGAVMVVDADPVALGEKMVADLQAKRKALGW